MLPRRARLSRRKEIEGVVNSRQPLCKGPLLSLYARENFLQGVRLAVITPGHLGKATKRNRVRRVFFCAFSKIRHKIAKNIDFVVYPRRAAVGLGLEQIVLALVTGLSKGQILKDEKIS